MVLDFVSHVFLAMFIWRYLFSGQPSFLFPAIYQHIGHLHHTSFYYLLPLDIMNDEPQYFSGDGPFCICRHLSGSFRFPGL